jgi:hypothetical protein
MKQKRVREEACNICGHYHDVSDLRLAEKSSRSYSLQLSLGARAHFHLLLWRPGHVLTILSINLSCSLSAGHPYLRLCTVLLHTPMALLLVSVVLLLLHTLTPAYHIYTTTV